MHILTHWLIFYEITFKKRLTNGNFLPTKKFISKYEFQEIYRNIKFFLSLGDFERIEYERKKKERKLVVIYAFCNSIFI